jgi:hypothetical protein
MLVVGVGKGGRDRSRGALAVNGDGALVGEELVALNGREVFPVGIAENSVVGCAIGEPAKWKVPLCVSSIVRSQLTTSLVKWAMVPTMSFTPTWPLPLRQPP